MDISIFEAVGPVMIGPSSSHTAGAAKLARAAITIIDEPISHVSFGLFGSFAKTYKGHGTDLALVAGILGLREDDERLTESFSMAQARNITYDFYETELVDVHENSVLMTFTLADGRIRNIVGSSIGGGQILIRKIDGLPLRIHQRIYPYLLRSANFQLIPCHDKHLKQCLYSLHQKLKSFVHLLNSSV